MIGAVSSKGKTFFAINQGRSNSLTFSLFLLNLIQELDGLDPEWRKTTTIMLDNASIHRAKATKAHLEAFGLPIMFLAPYSFKMAAVEKLFSFVKNRDLIHWWPGPTQGKTSQPEYFLSRASTEM